MKTLLFTLSLLFCFYISLGQARIGSPEWKIRSDFSDQIFSTGYTDEGAKYIYWEDKSKFVAYYLNDEGVCHTTIVFPKNQGTLNYMVENFNSRYVIVSDTKWKMYTENGIMYIELIFEDDGHFFLMY